MTETISIYTYIQGFQQFEIELHRGIALPDHRAPHRGLVRAIRRMGLPDDARRGIPPGRCATPRRDRLRPVLLVPGLLAVHHLLQDAEEIFRIRRSGIPEASIQFANYAVLFKDGDAVTVWNSLVLARIST